MRSGRPIISPGYRAAISDAQRRYARPSAPLPPRSAAEIAADEAREAREREAVAARQRAETTGRCCELAVRVECVCRRACVCPQHGSFHFGSHE